MTVLPASKYEHPVSPSEPNLIFDSAASPTCDARLLGIYGGSERFCQMGVVAEPSQTISLLGELEKVSLSDPVPT